MEEKVIDMNIPNGVVCILDQLNKNGFEAYIVGGCIRDSIRNKEPKDWDITTSALPEQVKEIFTHTYDTGIKHGTVTIILNNQAYEITTFRIEGIYRDHRKPSSVSFTYSLLEDLKRRDFTMNAIAFHPEKGFIDPFDGKGDILKRVIRCVGNPSERFNEDSLRMLRAIRFACQLDFKIDQCSLDAIYQHRELILNISMERIREELNKMLMSEYPLNLLLMKEGRLMEYILPELDRCFLASQNHPYHVYTVGMHILKAVENIEKNIILKWTMLLHDIGKPVCKTTDDKGIDHFYGHGEESVRIGYDILKRLKFDKKSADMIIQLVRWHDRPIEPTDRAVRKAVRIMGKEIFLNFLKVKEADIKSQNSSCLSQRLKQLETVKEIYAGVIFAGQCLSLDDLAVNGNDLVEIGVPKGKGIGVMLNELLEMVISEPQKNEKETLLNIAKHSISK
ncbi:MAG: CCA tRNA nucleotidyltransferase [Clostridia bacterium]